MNEDGMSYLDMAIQAAQGQPSALVHQYWSPLYPSLLAIAFKIFGTAPEHEFRTVHAVDACIALLGLAAFTYFLREWSALRRGFGYVASAKLESIQVAFAYALFFWCAIETTGVGIVSPDALVNAFVFAAAGIGCRIVSGAGGKRAAAVLGLVLGLAYLAKAALLPLGAAFLVLMLVFHRKTPIPSAVVVAATALLLVCGPLIIVLSSNARKLTFGESGRLNYVWMVQKDIPRLFGWIGGTANSGTPVHPPRILNEKPKVFEYAGTVNGTYPPWYDPYYFHEGVRLHFDARKQIETVLLSLHEVYWAHQRNMIPLFAGLLFLFVVGERPVIRQKVFDQLWLMLWPLIAIASFSLVLMQSRYISAFLVLAWLLAYDAVTPQRPRRIHRIIFAIVSTAVVAIVIYTQFGRPYPKPPDDLQRARELTRLGLRPGDRIAILGTGFDAYYAHLARLKIVAEVTPPEEFWSVPDSEIASLLEKFRRTGVRALVSPENCLSGAGKQWHALDRIEMCVRIVQ